MTRHRLSKSMSAAQFDNGYWYATELKAFADAIGIPSANTLRKDELEKAIKHFLRTGTIRSPIKKKPLAARPERRRSRAPPGPSCFCLHERRGNQAFPRVRITKTRSGPETKIGCALPAQSLAGTATHQRRETDVWRVGQTVRSALSAQDAIRQDSPREIHQLHE